MSKKLYSTDQGGIRFISYRMGQVRIPNYVYDMWLPLLGATAIGVYSMYCRLEREDVVKAITQARIAKMCRIGTRKLEEINEMLEDCRFISVTKPEGHKRLMHWTTEIEIFEAPERVPPEMVEKYAPPSGYECLSPWLVTEKSPNISGEVTEQLDEESSDSPNVVSLGLNPLEDTLPPQRERDLPVPEIVEWTMNDSLEIEFRCTNPYCDEVIVIADLAKVGAECPYCHIPVRVTNERGTVIKNPSQKVRRQESGNVSPAAGFDDKPLQAFCIIYGIPYAGLTPKKKKQWAYQIKQVADENDADADLTYKAIRGIKDSEHSWQSYTSPFSQKFKDLLAIMIIRFKEQKGATGAHATAAEIAARLGLTLEEFERAKNASAT